MKFGVFGINFGPCAEPAAASRVAQAAEAAGFDSVWTGEHVVLPDPQQPPSPAPPQTPFLDPAAALSFVAARTERIRLATGIIILPQRNPVVLAKEMASVDVLSSGRLILGVAAGYLHQEFAAVGAPFAERGARTDEYIDAMRALWSEPKPSFHGKFVSFAGIDAQPRPVQKPHPELVVGGHSSAAHRRAVRRAHGWYGFALDLDATRQALAGIAEARKRVERPRELGELEISITPPPGLTLDDARRYADLGVDRLVLLVPARDADGVLAQVDAAASDLLGRV
jgi:probable F420-dependent oxidoreductase